MKPDEEITASTVGQLIEKLQALDPNMKLGYRGTMGEISPNLTLIAMEIMKHTEDHSYAVRVDDPVWNKRRHEFFEPFVALVAW